MNMRLFCIVILLAVTLACSLAIRGELGRAPRETPCPQGNP